MFSNNPDGGDRSTRKIIQIQMQVKSNFLVGSRQIHKPSPKVSVVFLSYRYFHLYQSTTSQVDYGQVLQGGGGAPTRTGHAVPLVVLHSRDLCHVLAPLNRKTIFSSFSYTHKFIGNGSFAKPQGLGAAIEKRAVPWTARLRSELWPALGEGHNYILRDNLSTWGCGQSPHFAIRKFRPTLDGCFTPAQQQQPANMITTPTRTWRDQERDLSSTAYIVSASSGCRREDHYAQALGNSLNTAGFYPPLAAFCSRLGPQIKAASVVNKNLPTRTNFSGESTRPLRLNYRFGVWGLGGPPQTKR